MTLKDFIALLLELAEGNEDVEVVAVNHESGESYTPAIAIGPDSDGVRRLFLN